MLFSDLHHLFLRGLLSFKIGLDQFLPDFRLAIMKKKKEGSMGEVGDGHSHSSWSPASFFCFGLAVGVKSSKVPAF